MILSKVIPFIRTVCLALVYFDIEILPCGYKFCNSKSGSQPTLCEPLGRENEGNEKSKTMVECPTGVLFGGGIGAMFGNGNRQ